MCVMTGDDVLALFIVAELVRALTLAGLRYRAGQKAAERKTAADQRKSAPRPPKETGK
jgi:hypothetical protein